MSILRNKSLVIDIGTANTKVGQTGEEQPQLVIKSLIGSQKYSQIFKEGHHQKIVDPQGADMSLCQIEEIVTRGEYNTIEQINMLFDHIKEKLELKSFKQN